MKPIDVFQLIKAAAEAVVTLEEPGTNTPEFREWRRLIDRLHDISIQSNHDYIGDYYDWLYRNKSLTKEEAEYFTKFWRDQYETQQNH